MSPQPLLQDPQPDPPARSDPAKSHREEEEEKYDETLEDSFPASDPPPGPSKIGPRRDRAAQNARGHA